MQTNTTLWIVVTVIAVHFIIGVGWLFYKIAGAKPPKKSDTEENEGQV